MGAFSGRCHCGNLEVSFETALGAEDLPSRACDCSFCVGHGVQATSDPKGHVTIRVRNAAALNRYRFGLRTADFLICRSCGIYVGAVLTDGDLAWATINRNVIPELQDVGREPTRASYGNETESARRRRRRERWTPAVVILGGQKDREVPFVVLRPTRPPDLEFVVAAEEDVENRPFILPWPKERHAEVLESTDFAHRIIEAGDPAHRVGFVLVAGLEDPHGSIELRRIVVTEKRRGYGRAALREVTRWAFEERGAHRLWLDVFEDNERARRLYESEGFSLEGTLRERVRVGGRWRTLAALSILEDEYRRR